MQQFRTKNLFTSRNLYQVAINSAETLTGGRRWTGICRREIIISPTPALSSYRQLKKPIESVPRFCSMSVKIIPHPVLSFSLSEKGSKTSSFQVLVLDLVKIHSFGSG